LVWQFRDDDGPHFAIPSQATQRWERMASDKKIFCVSYDAELLSTRRLVLQQAGFAVSTATSLEEAKRCLGHEDFDLAIIGHSMPRADREVLAREIKRSNADTVIISLYRGIAESEELAEASLSISAGPEALVDLVTSLFG
jgi:DNA-binding NtrC family response regulator